MNVSIAATFDYGTEQRQIGMLEMWKKIRKQKIKNKIKKTRNRNMKKWNEKPKKNLN